MFNSIRADLTCPATGQPLPQTEIQIETETD